MSEVEQEIAVAEFERFRDFFYRKTGIHFADSKRYFVDKRLIERMRQTGHDSFRQYFSFMRFQASGLELQALINCMTVNETYFFREAYQFDCLVNDALREITAHKNPGDTIRIWSIPSSTGEEPYSIAIYLLERWADIDKYDIEIVSSDIDSSALEKCKQGLYSERSVGQLPTHYKQKYFTREGNQYQLCDDLRSSVHFSQVNLADLNQTRRFRGFDVVFCRNLLIYFDDLSRKDAAEVFYSAMNPGGFVFLGHSESMSRISSRFTIKKFKDAMAYQKPRGKQ